MTFTNSRSQAGLWIAVVVILVALVGGIFFLFRSPGLTSSPTSSPATQNQSGNTKTGSPDATSKTGIGGDGPVEQPKAPPPTGDK